MVTKRAVKILTVSGQLEIGHLYHFFPFLYPEILPASNAYQFDYDVQSFQTPQKTKYLW